jgi:DNA-binding NarL/FixJ family response regulator
VLGKTNPEIGLTLGLSSKAARNRVADVLAKLGVADRTQAAVLAVEIGLAVSPAYSADGRPTTNGVS